MALRADVSPPPVGFFPGVVVVCYGLCRIALVQLMNMLLTLLHVRGRLGYGLLLKSTSPW